MVPMVLNSYVVEHNFLKSPGSGCIPIITSNVLDYIKKEKMYKKKYAFKKILINFFKIGSIPYWV